MAAAGVGAAVFAFGLLAWQAWNNPAAVFIKASPYSQGEKQPAIITPAPEETTAAASFPDVEQQETGPEFEGSAFVNILLLGIDSNENRVEQNQGWRSDMVMLCTFDARKGRIFMTSIPRDTQTYVYYVDGDGQTTGKVLTKINHAYSYGGGPDKYGAQNAMLAVSDYLSDASGTHVPIDYFVSIDLQNIPGLADAFGGIPVELDVDFPDLGAKGEVVVLDSTNVKLFLQNRYDVGGDLARARHHEEFLLSMLKQFKAKGGIKYSTALFGFSVQYTKTNLDFQQMVALASLIEKCDLGDLDYKIIGGEYKYIGGSCYYLSDREDVKSRLSALMG